MSRIFKLSLSILAFVFLFTSRPTDTLAWTMRQGETVSLSKTELIKGSLFVVGQTLIIESRVDGDLYCAGRKVKVLAEVTGDVLCVAQDLEIVGKVGGDVRSAAQMILLDSQIMRNVNLFAQDITLGKSAKVMGELYTAGQEVTVDGQVMKSWGAAAENVTLNGRVEGEAQIAAENLSLGKTATVAAGITRVEIDEKGKKDKEVWQMSKAASTGFELTGKVTGLIVGLAYGLLIVWLFPGFLKKAASNVLDLAGKSMLWGIGIWLVAPVLLVLCVITLIGIPLAMILALGLMVIFFTSWSVASAALGARIMSKKTKLVWSFVVGTLVLSVISWLPVIGSLVCLAVVLTGTGAIKLTIIGKKKS